MGSRVREKVERLFEVFVEISKPNGTDEAPFIIQKYPPEFDDKEALMAIPKFAFPCPTDASKVDHFTFVLTDLDSMFRFGYSRHTTGHHTCFCIVSLLPWFEIFYKMLDLIADITNRSKKNTVTNFLHAIYSHDVPLPRISVTIVANEDMFSFTSPDPNALPGIPGSRNLTEYFSAVDPYNMMVVFASMLHERRIYMTSKKLSRLTACIHAAEALLYPMHWQHLYIPVLPAHLIDYVSAPMPFLIGVHSNLVEKLKQNRVDVGDAVVVDLDNNVVYTEYEDLKDLPQDVSDELKKSLKLDVVKSNMKTGDAISMAFLNALVRLIGGYRDALKFRRGEPITFDPEAFVRSRNSQSTQAFLESMLALQIFQQFIYGRLEILNSGAGFRDLFEQKAILYADKLNSQSKYKEWLKSVRKSGKKGWRGLKVKMKQQGKRAMADFKTKLSGFNDERRGSNPQIPSPVSYPKPSKVKRSSIDNAETTRRAVTTHAETTKRARPARPPPPSKDSHREYEKSRVKPVVQVHDRQEDNQLQPSDMNLMSDSDIQAVMLASSSGGVDQDSSEDSGSGSSYSDEEADETSISFGALQSSDEDDQVIAHSPHQLATHGKRLTTHSYSTHSSPGPTAQIRTSPSRSSLQPNSYSRLGRTHTSFDSASLQDAPIIKFDSASLQDAPLIKFDSSESDRTDSGSFDSLAKSNLESRPLVARSVSTESLESSGEVEIRPIQRDITSRVSLTRSKAFRRDTPTVPVRTHYLDDNDDLDGSRNNLDKDILEPLSHLTLYNNIQSSARWQTQPSVVGDPLPAHNPRRDTSDLLAHEWSLASLAKGPSIRLPVTEQPNFPIMGSSQNNVPAARQSIPSLSLSSTALKKEFLHNHQHSEPRLSHNQTMCLDQPNSQVIDDQRSESLDKRATVVQQRDLSRAHPPLDTSRLPHQAHNNTFNSHYSTLPIKSISPRTPGTMNFVPPTPSSSTPTVRGKLHVARRTGDLDTSFSSSSSSETSQLKDDALDLDLASTKTLDQSRILVKPDRDKVSPSIPSQPNANHKTSPRHSQPYTNYKVSPTQPPQPDINYKVSPSRPPQPDINHKVLPLRPPQPDVNHKVLSSQPPKLDNNHKVLPLRPPQPDVNHKVSPPIPSRPEDHSKTLPTRKSLHRWAKFS